MYQKPFHNHNSNQKAREKSEGQNKFMKLLVFLGILFMITFVKNFFNGSPKSDVTNIDNTQLDLQKV